MFSLVKAFSGRVTLVNLQDSAVLRSHRRRGTCHTRLSMPRPQILKSAIERATKSRAFAA